jgi:hypothetical protein
VPQGTRFIPNLWSRENQSVVSGFSITLLVPEV